MYIRMIVQTQKPPVTKTNVDSTQKHFSTNIDVVDNIDLNEFESSS